jgi:hypothetical protein
MFNLFFSFRGTFGSRFQTRAALQLEILALHYQINVLRTSRRGRVRLTELDRLCGHCNLKHRLAVFEPSFGR